MFLHSYLLRKNVRMEAVETQYFASLRKPFISNGETNEINP